ncbi:endo-1,4-beta-xylanase B [Corynespora cassiicola Philippines]|uniref:Endo-1,4-beta-xylanase B n=1 Tax=Corynespora cassiicola Philippines TaxID=1448308 RepID=A0A2T2P047_CORCC|nr:endo-1,4-beta-xylanase B [Corynespora cassiicola Philippines]
MQLSVTYAVKMKSFVPALLAFVQLVTSNPLMGAERSLYASHAKRELNNTDLTYFPSSNPNGNGVLVTPGGGYAGIAFDLEGIQPASWLNERGYDAWVLDYVTISNMSGPIYPVPQNQALEAVKQIRALNKVSKLGIWGFSAGGHLSAVTVTNSEADLDFAILSYPVITMDPTYTHAGSRTNLIGNNPSPELQYNMSAENRVTNSTPPVFLFHTANDPAVPVQNTLLFANAMASHGRPFQTLILPDGRHGLGLALSDPVRSWTTELDRWLKYSI